MHFLRREERLHAVFLDHRASVHVAYHTDALLLFDVKIRVERAVTGDYRALLLPLEI